MTTTRLLLTGLLMALTLQLVTSRSRRNRNKDYVTKQVVEPSLRDALGNRIYNVKDRLPFLSRTKRSTEFHGADDLTLTLGSRMTTVAVRPLASLTSSSSMLTWLSNNVTFSRPLNDGCLYEAHGTDDASLVGVLNLCGGVNGVVATASEEVTIAPADKSTNEIHRPHVLTRLHKSRPSRDFNRHRRHRGGAANDLRCGVKEGGMGKLSNRGDPHHRERRAIGGTSYGRKYLEVLVATDSSVVDFHGEDIVEQYILTQMFVVNSVYRHASLGVDLEMVVVSIIVLDERTADMLVYPGDAKRTLDRFCQWSFHQRPVVFPHEGQVDMAIYLTKRDIGPAGYAPVTGMCNPIRSCSVNKDDGISSAFVIAHEMGHVFGMQHDGFTNDCEDIPSDGRLMASYVQASYNMFYWSNCSRETMVHNIAGMHCLNNEPDTVVPWNLEEPIGRTWRLDQQCRQEFGREFQVCTAWLGNPCEYLWCSTKKEPLLCKTKRGQPLDGSTCAPGKWCQAGSCVARDVGPRDGGWSPWGRWGICNRDCGTGVRFRRRRCDDPEPSEGGLPCEGEADEVELCNMFLCAADMPSFREMQCSWLASHVTGEARKHMWRPLDIMDAPEGSECLLICQSQETEELHPITPDVMDGTLCSHRSAYDVCVKGQCKQAGCDGVFGSSLLEDNCGVCGGDGRGCMAITGSFSGYPARRGYYKVVILPRGARNVDVKQGYMTSHFLGVRAADDLTGQYFLNGEGQQTTRSHVNHGGVRFNYAIGETGDQITAKGPLVQPLIVALYAVKASDPVQVSYRYDYPSSQIYELINENIYGFRMHDAYDDTYVGTHDDLEVLTRPSTTTQTTTTTATTTTPPPTTTTTMTTTTRTVPPEEEHIVDPESLDTSTYDLNFWHVSEWSPCSVTCGHGQLYREAFCIDARSDRSVDLRFCDGSEKPNTTEPCAETPCLRWEIGDWQECTRPCGKYGRQERPLYCLTDFYGDPVHVDMAYCDATRRPVYVRDCNQAPCPADWLALPWGECSVSCGSGRESRVVLCDTPSDGDQYVCSGPRPVAHRHCHQPICQAITDAPTEASPPDPVEEEHMATTEASPPDPVEEEHRSHSEQVTTPHDGRNPTRNDGRQPSETQPPRREGFLPHADHHDNQDLIHDNEVLDDNDRNNHHQYVEDEDIENAMPTQMPPVNTPETTQAQATTLANVSEDEMEEGRLDADRGSVTHPPDDHLQGREEDMPGHDGHPYISDSTRGSSVLLTTLVTPYQRSFTVGLNIDHLGRRPHPHHDTEAEPATPATPAAQRPHTSDGTTVNTVITQSNTNHVPTTTAHTQPPRIKTNDVLEHHETAYHTSSTQEPVQPTSPPRSVQTSTVEPVPRGNHKAENSSTPTENSWSSTITNVYLDYSTPTKIPPADTGNINHNADEQRLTGRNPKAVDSGRTGVTSKNNSINVGPLSRPGNLGRDSSSPRLFTLPASSASTTGTTRGPSTSSLSNEILVDNREPPSRRPQQTSCKKDRSFFCRMGATAKQCKLHLYRTMCCATCHRVLLRYGI